MKLTYAFALASVAFAVAASTAVAGSTIIASYCAPETGDYCVAIKRAKGHIYFDLGTFSFRAYELCVTPPRGRGECEDFDLHRSSGSFYRSVVRWDRHFMNAGRGQYRVRWKFEGTTFARLAFRRR
jgi:hypothetical protein